MLEAGAHALETMLACGFDVGLKGGMGEAKLHWARFTGDATSARILIAHGAPIAASNKVHEAPPLGWCFYASLQPRGPRADFPGVARALLKLGAIVDAGQEGGAADDVLEAVAEFQRTKNPP